jgi:hypothetical protein
MLLCSVRARHDALGSVAEGIGCDAVVVRRKLELSLSYAPDHDPILFSTANPADEVFGRHRLGSWSVSPEPNCASRLPWRNFGASFNFGLQRTHFRRPT